MLPGNGNQGSLIQDILTTLRVLLRPTKARSVQLGAYSCTLESSKGRNLYRCETKAPFPQLGGVYMTPGRLSLLDEFIPVPSHGYVIVYMIPPQNVMPARVTPARVHPGSCTGARISLQYEISQRCHVNAKLPPVSV